MSKDTLVIVAPKLWEKLFGTPPTVSLPTRPLHPTRYDAHGARFECRMLRKDSYCLECALRSPVTLYGNASQMANWVGYTLEHGELPPVKDGAR